MAWLVFGIPFLTIIAGIIIIIIANKGADDLVKDDYYKEGLATNQQMEKLNKAKIMGLQANIIYDEKTNLIKLLISPEMDNNQTLLLNLSHPLEKRYDREIILNHLVENEYVGELKDFKSANWHVRLHNSSQEWLIKGRWNLPAEKTLLLNPAQE